MIHVWHVWHLKVKRQIYLWLLLHIAEYSHIRPNTFLRSKILYLAENKWQASLTSDWDVVFLSFVTFRQASLTSDWDVKLSYQQPLHWQNIVLCQAHWQNIALCLENLSIVGGSWCFGHRWSLVYIRATLLSSVPSVLVRSISSLHSLFHS